MAVQDQRVWKPHRGDVAIDTMRAIACLALVSFHVVGNTPHTGMDVPTDHWLSVLNRSLVDMRMPLFSFLSGVVFVSLGQTSRGPLAVIGPKVRRLLVPMLSVGALFWCARDLMGQEQQPLVAIAVMPFAHFWFLQATFVIMSVFVLLAWASGGRDMAVAGVLMAVGGVAWTSGMVPGSNVFSIIQALYLMPFFMCGYLCRRIGLPRVDGRLACLVLIALVMFGAGLATGLVDVPAGTRRIIRIACGLLFCVTLLSLRPESRILARLGAMSYAIYLFHVFFTAGLHAGLIHLWPAMPVGLLWLACLVAGVFGPVALYRLLVANTLLSYVFLGIKPRTSTHVPVASDQPGYALSNAKPI